MKYFEDFNRMSSPFGMRIHPISKKWQFHKGIDFVKKHKAPIYATVPGVVLHARNGIVGTGFGNFGIVVAIKDKYGALHCYVHLDSVSVKVGQTVTKGQEIGRQGATGRVTGSHLHYEVRKKSSPSFGWGSSENSVHEPIAYLDSYFEKEKPTYTDTTNHWASQAIETVSKQGLMVGYKDGTFKPDEPLTRAEMATILNRIGAEKK